MLPDVRSLVWHSNSEAQTLALAARLAKVLQPGDVLALQGDLGAGKTLFVRGLAMACGVAREAVTSPTFTLIHEYQGQGNLRIVHCDAYRLRHPDEFADLGWDELFAEDGVAVIEWADRVKTYLPADHLRVEILPTGPQTRTFTLTPTGPRSRQLGERLRALASSDECSAHDESVSASSPTGPLASA